MAPISVTSSSTKTVTSTSQKLLTMTPGLQYILHATVDLWFAVGPSSSVVATATTDGSHFMAYGATRTLAVEGANDTVAVILAGSSNGGCSLSVLREVPG